MKDKPISKLLAKIENGPGCQFPGGYVLLRSEFKQLVNTVKKQEAAWERDVSDARAAADRVSRAGRVTLLRHRIDELRKLLGTLPKGVTQDRLERHIQKRIDELAGTLRNTEND